MDRTSKRAPALETARRLVAEQLPGARAAWLSGSVVPGQATATSDLDITVLLDEEGPHEVGGPPYRASQMYAGWPVELFVHTPSSLRTFLARDVAWRKPSMARLVATGLPIVDGCPELRGAAAAVLEQGPPPLTILEVDAMRYALTDLLDDLAGGGTAEAMGAVAVATWRASAELLLGVGGGWWGTGMWLVHELRTYDAAAGTSYASCLHGALLASLDGDPGPLTTVGEQVLERAGGRLWAGYSAYPVPRPGDPANE